MRAWILAGGLACLLWGQSALAGTLLVVGDSISAALGLDTSQGWVALLEQRLAAKGQPYRVVNASISGDTSAGGLARLPRCSKSIALTGWSSNWVATMACAACRLTS